VSGFFRAFMDAAPEVYFRYALQPARRFAYIGPAVEMLTGHPAAAFLSDAAFCVPLVVREDRYLLRQVARARRALAVSIRLVRRDGRIVTVLLRTVPVVRGRQVTAIEGVAMPQPPAEAVSGTAPAPVQQRLTALLAEVHVLLHAHLPRGGADGGLAPAPAPLRIGPIAFDGERMAVTLAGAAVTLTTREMLVLKYLLERSGRVVTREQLLKEVWGYRYTGDARTVDVHVSRLRRKLPPIAGMLKAVKQVG